MHFRCARPGVLPTQGRQYAGIYDIFILMISRNEILDYLEIHFEEFRSRFSLNKIGLFGSYAREEATSKSDIDILIELDDGADHIYEKKKALKYLLEDRFNAQVDIAREKYLNQIVKKQIMDEVKYVKTR